MEAFLSTITSLASATLPAGTRLEEFEVLAPLGAGGMGEVYLARDHVLEREVAIKVVRSHLLFSERSRARLAEEARATARLSHPHIVTIHRLGWLGHQPFLVMERLRGQPLSAFRGQRVPVTQVVGWLAPVVQVLAAAHAVGLVHRDLKPENLFLCEDGLVKVLDFGLAALGDLSAEELLPNAGQAGAPAAEELLTPRSVDLAGLLDRPEVSVDAATQAGADGLFDEESLGTRSRLFRLENVQPEPQGAQRRFFAGTPRYLAPEQWRGEPASPATDLWAMGIILFELCAGQGPFAATRLAELRGAVTAPTATPDLRMILPECPDALAQLTGRLLSKAPGDRPPNAAHVAALLEALAAPTPAPTAISAPPPATAAQWLSDNAPPRWESLDALLTDWELLHPPIIGRHSPTQRDIPGETVMENVGYFREQGGDVPKLLSRINSKIRARAGEQGFYELHEGILRDPGYWYSNEINFLLVMAMKVATGDDTFGYRAPGDGPLSTGHKLFESGPIRGCLVRNWQHGDLRGVNVRNTSSVLRYLREQGSLSGGVGVRRLDGPDAVRIGLQVVNTLFVCDDQPVAEDVVANDKLWSHPAAQHSIFETGKIVSGRPDVIRLACRTNFSKGLKLLAQVLSLRDLYRAMSYFSNQYTRLQRVVCLRTSNRDAVIVSIRTPQSRDFTGQYDKGCHQSSCDLTKNTMASVPEAVFGITGTTVTETCCAAVTVPEEDARLHESLPPGLVAENGEAYCQYLYRWPARLTGYQRIVDPAVLAGLAAAPALAALWTTGWPLPARLLGSLGALSVPPLVHAARRARRDRRERGEMFTYMSEQEDRLAAERTRLTMREIELASQRGLCATKDVALPMSADIDQSARAPQKSGAFNPELSPSEDHPGTRHTH